MSRQPDETVDLAGLSVGTISIIVIATVYLQVSPGLNSTYGIAHYVGFIVAWWFIIKPVTLGYSRLLG